jgi:hypothetical protein
MYPFGHFRHVTIPATHHSAIQSTIPAIPPFRCHSAYQHIKQI